MAGEALVSTPQNDSAVKSAGGPEETAAAQEKVSVPQEVDIAPPPGLESFGNSQMMPKKIQEPSLNKRQPSKTVTVEDEGSIGAQPPSPGTKRFCVYCGAQVPPKLITAKFCVYCGQAHSGQEVPNDMEGLPARVPLPQPAAYSTPAGWQGTGFDNYLGMVQQSTVSNRAVLQTFMAELAAQQGGFYNNSMGWQSYIDDASPQGEYYGDQDSYSMYMQTQTAAW